MHTANQTKTTTGSESSNAMGWREGGQGFPAESRGLAGSRDFSVTPNQRRTHDTPSLFLFFPW